MIDPETARQAAAEWERCNAGNLTFPESYGALKAAGDDLAVLVPQLLDQLAELREQLEASRSVARAALGDAAVSPEPEHPNVLGFVGALLDAQRPAVEPQPEEPSE